MSEGKEQTDKKGKRALRMKESLTEMRNVTKQKSYGTQEGSGVIEY